MNPFRDPQQAITWLNQSGVRGECGVLTMHKGILLRWEAYKHLIVGWILFLLDDGPWEPSADVPALWRPN